MPLIFLGKGLKHHMLSYFVGWSGVPSSGKTWTKLIESEGPMLKNMCWIGLIGLSHQIPQVESHGSVKVSKQVSAHILMIMKPMESYRSTYQLTISWG